MKKAKTQSFVMTLRLDTTESDEAILAKRFGIVERMYNIIMRHGIRQMHRMRRDSEYKDVLKQHDKSNKYTKEEKNKLFDLRMKYGLSEYMFHSFVVMQQNKYKMNIDSNTSQKIASAAWSSIKKSLFDYRCKSHFKKRGSLRSIEGKSNKTGIRFKGDRIEWLKLSIPVFIKEKDAYAKECLTKHEVKYCRIIRKWHKHKYRYYVQLVMEGTPPIKKKLDASDSRSVGIDIGPSTIAVSSRDGVIFQELGESISRIDKELAVLQRKQDRQRRANNPQNYNEDGTIRRRSKNFKRAWRKSHRQRLTEDAVKELYAKRAAKLKQSHEMLANRILSLGTEVIVEKMEMQGLAKRSRETKISEKTGRFVKKKRYGKSIANHAPSMLISILDRKLASIEKSVHRIDASKICASQINHITGERIKADLSQRWKDLDDSIKVQRDLYSAFLLEHLADTYDAVDYTSCFNDFDSFMSMHDSCISRLKENKRAGQRYPSCMGI